MSNIEELNKRIANANALSEKLNRERAVNLGKRDTLKEQLETAIREYNNTYKRNLSIENIESEIKEVSDAKEKELSHLESILNAISSGNYELANQLAGVSGESPTTTDVSSVINSNAGVSASEPEIKTSESSADTPTPSAPSPTSFSAILGGTAFTL